jgi:hypothetical protein
MMPLPRLQAALPLRSGCEAMPEKSWFSHIVLPTQYTAEMIKPNTMSSSFILRRKFNNLILSFHHS